MTHQHRQPNELESLIAEVRQLDEAGVFNRTPVSPASLLAEVGGPTQPRWHHRLYVGLQVAACVGLVAGAATLWRASNSATNSVSVGGSGYDVASVVGDQPTGTMELLTYCLAGPGASGAGSDCSTVDLDLDGDVDLADFGLFQTTFAGGR